MKKKQFKFLFNSFQKIYPYYSREIGLNISRDEFVNYLKSNTESGFGKYYDHSTVINYNYPKNEKKYECEINFDLIKLREVLSTENIKIQLQRPVFSIQIVDSSQLILNCKMRQSTFQSAMTLLYIFSFFYFQFLYFYQNSEELELYLSLLILTMHLLFIYFFKKELNNFLTFIKNAEHKDGF
jgi:hypothetical protein